jgi:hypothetical protein
MLVRLENVQFSCPDSDLNCSQDIQYIFIYIYHSVPLLRELNSFYTLGRAAIYLRQVIIVIVCTRDSIVFS